MSTRIAPGPDGEHLMGALSKFRRNSLGLVTDLQQRYGGVVRVRLGPYLVHQVTDPDAVKHILQDRADNYRRGRFYQGFSQFMGRGMLTSDGTEWRRRRELSQPFFRRSRLDGAVPIIVDCVEDLLERWSQPAERGAAVEVVDDLMWLSMGVLSRTLFGTDLRRRAPELLPAVKFSLTAMIISGKSEQMLPRWVPTRYRRDLNRHTATLNRVVDDVVTLHRAGGGDPDDLVTALLAATEPETGDPWSDRAIRAELKTHFMAGHETTGCGLAWTLHAIAQHVDVRRRLEAELDEVLAGAPPSAADLARLPYLRQVVDESLRINPPIWLFPREAIADDEIGGYHVPAGTSVLLPPYATHHSPENWANPEAFDPERFCPAKKGPTRYSYIPFGGGARRCIGHHLALLEIQTAVAMIVQRYRLSLAPGRPVVPVGLVSLRPGGGLRMRVERRAGPA